MVAETGSEIRQGKSVGGERATAGAIECDHGTAWGWIRGVVHRVVLVDGGDLAFSGRIRREKAWRGRSDRQRDRRGEDVVRGLDLQCRCEPVSGGYGNGRSKLRGR